MENDKRKNVPFSIFMQINIDNYHNNILGYTKRKRKNYFQRHLDDNFSEFFLLQIKAPLVHVTAKARQEHQF